MVNVVAPHLGISVWKFWLSTFLGASLSLSRSSPLCSLARRRRADSSSLSLARRNCRRVVHSHDDRHDARPDDELERLPPHQLAQRARPWRQCVLVLAHLALSTELTHTCTARSRRRCPHPRPPSPRLRLGPRRRGGRPDLGGRRPAQQRAPAAPAHVAVARRRRARRGEGHSARAARRDDAQQHGRERARRRVCRRAGHVPRRGRVRRRGARRGGVGPPGRGRGGEAGAEPGRRERRQGEPAARGAGWRWERLSLEVLCTYPLSVQLCV